MYIGQFSQHNHPFFVNALSLVMDISHIDRTLDDQRLTAVLSLDLALISQWWWVFTFNAAKIKLVIFHHR